MDNQESKDASDNQRVETKKEKERDLFADMKDVLAVLPSYLKPCCPILRCTEDMNVLKITQDSVRDQFGIMFDQLDEVVSKKALSGADQLKSLHKWFRKFSGFFLHISRFERVRIFQRFKGEVCGEELKELMGTLEKKCAFEEEMGSIRKLFRKLWVFPGVTHKLSSTWSTVLLEIVKRCHALATEVLDSMEAEMSLFARAALRLYCWRQFLVALCRRLIRSLWMTPNFRYNLPALVESINEFDHGRNLINATMPNEIRKLYYKKLQRQYGDKYVHGWKVVAQHERNVERVEFVLRNGTQNI